MSYYKQHNSCKNLITRLRQIIKEFETHVINNRSWNSLKCLLDKVKCSDKIMLVDSDKIKTYDD